MLWARCWEPHNGGGRDLRPDGRDWNAQGRRNRQDRLQALRGRHALVAPDLRLLDVAQAGEGVRAQAGGFAQRLQVGWFRVAHTPEYSR
jgi:hypothetical protein